MPERQFVVYFELMGNKKLFLLATIQKSMLSAAPLK
jgi:hypothetical protein